jgi:hypothetical protein
MNKTRLETIFAITLQAIVLVVALIFLGKILDTFIPNRYLQLPFWVVVIFGIQFLFRKRENADYKQMLIRSLPPIFFGVAFIFLKDYPTAFIIVSGIGLFGLVIFKLWRNPLD